jgi:hypothetical protein
MESLRSNGLGQLAIVRSRPPKSATTALVTVRAWVSSIPTGKAEEKKGGKYRQYWYL